MNEEGRKSREILFMCLVSVDFPGDGKRTGKEIPLFPLSCLSVPGSVVFSASFLLSHVSVDFFSLVVKYTPAVKLPLNWERSPFVMLSSAPSLLPRFLLPSLAAFVRLFVEKQEDVET